MFMKKFALLAIGLVVLGGCTGQRGGDWGGEWGYKNARETPENIDDIQIPDDNVIRNVAVLLPLSGAGGGLGTGIQRAIEIAFFQKQPKNILVSFHDIAGRPEDRRRVMESVVVGKPDMIIGPLFADDVETLRGIKPKNIPAITFTSARNVLGDGMFTMALLPNQAVEAIVKHIKDEGKSKTLLLAPSTSTGHMLTNTAIEAAKIYGLDIAGVYFYEEYNTGEMNDLAEKAALFEARVGNLAQAKEILSDALIHQKLTAAERESIRTQLEDLNKRDSLGDVPYDAVLFLSNAADSKTLGAYLRYYDVSSRNTTFYGSALWDADPVYRDSSLAGGEYAGLVRINDEFSKIYSEIEGVKPNRFNTVGFDAAMLAIKSLSGGKPVGAWLVEPSGYRGIDGLVRLRPNGENERALQVMQLNGVRLPMIKARAPRDFTKEIYKTEIFDVSRPARKNLASEGYNPMDHISLPDQLKDRYKATVFGKAEEYNPEALAPDARIVEEDPEIVTDAEFQPKKLDAVDKKYIDEVRMKSSQ
jgi:hypothetical protein